MGEQQAIEQLQSQLEQLLAERHERSNSLPAHSIRPHQLLILEELDEEIASLQMKIDASAGREDDRE